MVAALTGVVVAGISIAITDLSSSILIVVLFLVVGVLSLHISG